MAAPEHPVRMSFRLLLALALWCLAASPVLLWILHLRDPPAAVRVQHASLALLGSALWYLAVAALVLAILWPPFPAGVRHAFALARGNLQRDARPFQRAVADLRHFESAQRRLDAGRAALAAGDAKAAIPHLERAVEMDPQLLGAWHQLGTALLALGRTRPAIEALQRAIDEDPGIAFGDAMLQLGRAWMLVGDHESASRWLERHSRDHGGNRKSHYWLGRCRLALGDRDGAREAFRIAAAPPPQRPRLTSEEGLFRARARTALWRLGGSGNPRGGDPRGGGAA